MEGREGKEDVEDERKMLRVTERRRGRGRNVSRSSFGAPGRTSSQYGRSRDSANT
jgi:hypothetical protein